MFVNALEGEIFLESEEGKGSIFTIMLPEVKPPAYDEITAMTKSKDQVTNYDNRIIQSVSIEFSDIYFD